jgi:predicted nucleic acid-binding protein
MVDTNILIDLPWYEEAGLLPDEVITSAVSLAELAYGVAAAPSPLEQPRRNRVYARLRSVLDVQAFDADCADAYTDLIALVLASNRSPRPRRLDLMIAATAVVHQVPLYTANATDFIGCDQLLDVVALPSAGK